MNAAAAARTGPWADVLEDRGHEVVVLTSREAVGEGDPRVWASRFGVPSNQVGLVRRFLQEVRLGRDIAGELRRRVENLDLAVITSPPFFLATLCAKVARRCSLPYVFDVRDRYPGVLFELDLLSPSGLPGKWLSRMEQKAYAGAKLIATVTHSLKKELGETVDPKKVLRVPNGFDGVLFPEELAERRKQENFTVVYHGRFSRLHDVDALRRLAAVTRRLDPDVRFVVAGPVPDDLREGDWGATTFLGELPRGEIPGLLAECHLGVSLMKPSGATRVAMPAKVFEYLGAGLPLLAAPEGELCEFIRERGIGLAFDVVDPQAMAEAIVSLKSNAEAWNRMSAKARALRPELDRRITVIPFAKRLESLS